MARKKILFVVLNWGLGHATRSIPIIQTLKKMGFEVQLASDGRAKYLLEKEFGHDDVWQLPSYGVEYKYKNILWNVAAATHRVSLGMLKEHFLIRKWIKKHNFDLVISDNRYGSMCCGVPSLFICHQIQLITPFRFLNGIASWFSKMIINRFDACLIPDREKEHSLAGFLSHAEALSIPYYYLGAVSTMQKENTPTIKWDAIFILSGPEPQRTQLEIILKEQIKSLSGKYLMVLGKSEKQGTEYSDNLEIRQFMTRKELNLVMNEANIVVSRSGYSTILDLAKLEKKALLIPTPGQTEQEYLSDYFSKKNIFFSVHQDEIDLKTDLLNVENYSGLRKYEELDLEEKLKKIFSSIFFS